MVYSNSKVKIFVELSSIFTLQKAVNKVNLSCEFDVISILKDIEIDD